VPVCGAFSRVSWLTGRNFHNIQFFFREIKAANRVFYTEMTEKPDAAR
jgi:hypothetical protein